MPMVLYEGTCPHCDGDLTVPYHSGPAIIAVATECELCATPLSAGERHEIEEEVLAKMEREYDHYVARQTEAV